MPSYHDLYITTREIPRTRLFDLPFSFQVLCTRTGGWEIWNGETLVAGEYETIGKGGLRLDVNGNVIIDSLKD